MDGNDFDRVMETIVRGFEAAGVAILVVGALIALVSAARTYRPGRAGSPTSRRDGASVAPSCWGWNS